MHQLKTYHIEVKVDSGYWIKDLIDINILPQEDKSIILMDLYFNGRFILYVLIYLLFIALYIYYKVIYLSFWFFLPMIGLFIEIMNFKKSVTDKIFNYIIAIEHTLPQDPGILKRWNSCR